MSPARQPIPYSARSAVSHSSEPLHVDGAPGVAAASSSSANEQLAANEHSVPEETEDMDMALKQALNQMEEEEG